MVSSELDEPEAPLALDPLELLSLSTGVLPDVPISPPADDPTPGLVVSPPDAPLPEPELPEALEPWFAPLDCPVELFPELEPERLVPEAPELEPDCPLAEPEDGLWTSMLDCPELDEPDEPDEPELPELPEL